MTERRDSLCRVVSLSERRYRDFPWHPDPSLRADVPYRGLTFSEKCALNALEALARTFAGQSRHPRRFTDGKGNLFWREQ